MKRNLYVIYDKVAEESGPVQEFKNDGIANRWYAEIMAKDDVTWNLSADFELYHLGEIDKTTNIINPMKPRLVEIKLSMIDEENEG